MVRFGEKKAACSLKLPTGCHSILGVCSAGNQIGAVQIVPMCGAGLAGFASPIMDKGLIQTNKQLLETDVRKFFGMSCAYSLVRCRKKDPRCRFEFCSMEGSVYEFGSNLQRRQTIFLEPNHDLRLFAGRGYSRCG